MLANSKSVWNLQIHVGIFKVVCVRDIFKDLGCFWYIFWGNILRTCQVNTSTYSIASSMTLSLSTFQYLPCDDTSNQLFLIIMGPILYKKTTNLNEIFKESHFLYYTVPTLRCRYLGKVTQIATQRRIHFTSSTFNHKRWYLLDKIS